MTIQEAFEKVVRGLAAQGWKKAAVGGDWQHGAAKLRTSNGLKCAIGQLIPDSVYKPKMEMLMDRSVGSVLDAAGVEIEGPELILNKCVDAHDSAENRLDMHQKFQAVAIRYGLVFPLDLICTEFESEQH